MHVFTLLAEQPDLRLRDIANEVGITERAAHRIVSELVQGGHLARERHGTRNRYSTLRPPLGDGPTAEMIRRAIVEEEPVGTAVAATSDGSSRFHAVFNAVPAGVVVADATGTIIAVNHEFCRILGRSEGELVGSSFREHTHPDEIAADEERLVRLVSGDRAEYSREKRYIRADGTHTWVNVRVVRTVEPETGARLLVAHVVEIGERMRQQQKLAEAEERFRSAFDNAPIGMALVSPDGRSLKVNRAVCDITGYSETELLTRTFQSITHPDDLDIDREFIRRMLAGEIRTYQTDKRYRHADGHLIWVTLSVSLVRDPSGEPLYFIAQTQDITDRRASEEAFSQVVDRIAEAVSIIDSDGGYLHVNEPSRSIRQDLRERFERGSFAELDSGAVAEDGTPLPADKLPAEITRLTGEEVDDAVIGFPSASEDVRWLRISTRRLVDGPAPHQVIVSYTDVTRRKQAERALALSQARLHGLFRYIPAALTLRDLDGHYLDVTDSVARALGCTPEDAVGRHPSEHLKGEPLTEALADDEAMRNGSGPISREVSFAHADGSEHDYFVVKWPVLDENGAVAAFGAFSLDITERKHAEQGVLEMLNSAPDAIVIAEESGKIRIVNTQAEKLFGYSRDELLGQDIETLVPDRIRRAHAAHRAGYAADPHVRPMGEGLELFGRRRDGSEFPVEISLSPLHTADGMLVSAAIRDVTHRKASERELQRSRAELARVNSELEHFALVISRHLSEPLHTVAELADLLAMRHGDSLGERGDGYTRRIVATSTHVSRFIEDLSDYSRLGSMQTRRTRVAVREVVVSVVDRLARALADSGATVEIGWLPVVEADEAQLHELFRHLIENAVKFHDHGRPKVSVDAQHTDEGWRFTVEDNGIGIDPSEAKRVFEPFHRLHTHEEYPGNGIGLAVCARIVEHHGGRIWVEPETDGGSMLVFTLPSASR